MSLIPLNVVVAFFAFYVLIYVVLWVMRVFAVMISVCVCPYRYDWCVGLGYMQVKSIVIAEV